VVFFGRKPRKGPVASIYTDWETALAAKAPESVRQK
jgi:hypothetical protein